MGHSTRRLMMGAAGAGGDPTYVEDVFSTYLWRGDGNSGRPIINGIKLGNANSGTSVLFDDNVNDYLEIAHTTDLCVGSGDFTIECWAYHIGDFGSWDGLFGNWSGSGDNGYILETVGSGATTDLEFYYYPDGGGSYVGPVQGGTVSSNQWNHLCVCRSGNTIRLFVNGTMHGSGTSITTGIRNGTSNFTIGGQVAGGGWWNGYISNLRVTKGQALYTSNFTPSTDPLTTTSQGATASNVKLLCCNKDTATGSTKTPGTITAHGDTHIKSFGPFTGTDGEGGLVWIRRRNQATDHYLYDTTSGATKYLASNDNMAQQTDTATLTGFNNSGFTLGSNGGVNGNGNDFVGWTWRKQKGFFDIVTWSGNGTAGRTIAHSLGSVPGCIMIKNTNNTQNWQVYHRGIGAGSAVFLDLNYAKQTGAQFFNNVEPTSTHFTLGTDCMNNCSGYDYIAYVFAGGESTAATARSVHFSSNYMNTTTSSSDFTMGTGDFTIECWVNRDDQGQCGVFQISDTSGGLKTSNYGNTLALASVGNVAPGRWQIYGAGSYAEATPGHAQKQWVHVAYVRHNGVSKFYQDGIELISQSDTTNYDGTYIAIGAYYDTSLNYKGYISNFRVVKGTAVYTSSFTPPTEPLKNISGTVLLCLNDSSVTGATVTPQTLNSQGGPTASTNSPFDDPEGYKFGEGGDQNIVQCGQFKTDSGNGAILNLPWEPQWIIYKHVNANSDWHMLDCMRGWTTDGLDNYLYPNNTNAEIAMNGGEELKARTIKFQGYGNNYDFIYMAIRRPDPLVAKPVEVGSDVFAVERGNSSSIEAYTSGFPVDFSLVREIGNASDWHQNSRLTQTYYLSTNTNGAQNGPYSAYSFDSNTGWLHGASAYNASWLSWMWKRHAGFDVVCYEGKNLNGGPRAAFAHNLNKIPEMIWVKRRDSTNPWSVYHKGLNGGSNPEGYGLQLNTTSAEASSSTRWANTAPSSTHFFVGGNSGTNYSGSEHIAMLFASVEGVSKVGYYDGTGSAGNVQNIGFQPKFIMIKRANAIENWPTFNTILGLGAGNDPWLNIDDDASQFTGQDLLSVSSTGFTLNDGQAMMNASGGKYIYYAHA